MSLPAALWELLDELSLYPDRAERIQALIEIAEQYSPAEAAGVPRNAETRVPGCESEVFFQATDNPDGTQSYLYGVDNPQGISAMSLAVILQRLSGTPRSEVARISEEVVFQIFGRDLSMGKSLGLTNMVKVMKQAASG